MINEASPEDPDTMKSMADIVGTPEGLDEILRHEPVLNIEVQIRDRESELKGYEDQDAALREEYMLTEDPSVLAVLRKNAHSRIRAEADLRELRRQAASGG